MGLRPHNATTPGSRGRVAPDAHRLGQLLGGAEDVLPAAASAGLLPPASENTSRATQTPAPIRTSRGRQLGLLGRQPHDLLGEVAEELLGPVAGPSTQLKRSSRTRSVRSSSRSPTVIVALDGSTSSA